MNRRYYGGSPQSSLVRTGMFINAAVHTRAEPQGKDLPMARLLATCARRVRLSAWLADLIAGVLQATRRRVMRRSYLEAKSGCP
jgi:hypothetical protein